jgi:hypothetical protein
MLQMIVISMTRNQDLKVRNPIFSVNDKGVGMALISGVMGGVIRCAMAVSPLTFMHRTGNRPKALSGTICKRGPS